MYVKSIQSVNSARNLNCGGAGDLVDKYGLPRRPVDHHCGIFSSATVIPEASYVNCAFAKLYSMMFALCSRKPTPSSGVNVLFRLMAFPFSRLSAKESANPNRSKAYPYVLNPFVCLLTWSPWDLMTEYPKFRSTFMYPPRIGNINGCQRRGTSDQETSSNPNSCPNSIFRKFKRRRSTGVSRAVAVSTARSSLAACRREIGLMISRYPRR